MRQACAALTARLSELEESQIIEFEDDLSRVVHALDTPAHADQLVNDVDDPPGVPPELMSGDQFLYARLAVVLAGEQTYTTVLADPTAMAGRWALDAENLLSVAADAYEQRTGLLWEHQAPLSMETGSNATAWGRDSDRANEGDEPDADDDDRYWLTTGLGFDVATDNRYFTMALFGHFSAIVDDPAWTQWWAHCAYERLEVMPSYLTDPTEPVSVRHGRSTLRIEGDVDGSELVGADRNRAEALAEAEVGRLMGIVGQAHKLPPCPPVPARNDDGQWIEEEQLPSFTDMVALLSGGEMGEADVERHVAAMFDLTDRSAEIPRDLRPPSP